MPAIILLKISCVQLCFKFNFNFDNNSIIYKYFSFLDIFLLFLSDKNFLIIFFSTLSLDYELCSKIISSILDIIE